MERDEGARTYPHKDDRQLPRSPPLSIQFTEVDVQRREDAKGLRLQRSEKELFL